MCQFANVSITCIVIDSLANCFIGKWSHCIIILVAKICLHNPRFVWWLVYQLQVHWACSPSRITVWVTPPLPFTWALTKLSCCSMSCTSLFLVSFLAFCLGQCSEALSYHKRLGDIAPKKARHDIIFFEFWTVRKDKILLVSARLFYHRGKRVSIFKIVHLSFPKSSSDKSIGGGVLATEALV